MYNDPEVSAELHRIADDQPLTPFDTAAVLNRGRTTRRRRKYLSIGGAVTGVAAAAVVATFLSGSLHAGGKPPVAGDQQENSQFSAVPGVPRGEDGVAQKLSRAETERRCSLRYPGEKRPLSATTTRFISGRPIGYAFDKTAGGSAQPQRMACLIPGGDRPSAVLIAAAKADPLPTTDANRLRNCSVAAWTDMTTWQIKAFDQSAKLKEAWLVAVSPSGRTAISCQLGNSRMWVPQSESEINAVKTDKMDAPVLPPVPGAARPDLLRVATGAYGCESYQCSEGSSAVGWGRAAANATTVKLERGPGPGHEVKVTDGWFAMAWFRAGALDTKKRLTITAYDKDGKVVRVLRTTG
ncbi:hypothetical protein E1263_01870 [Kribbella antibiotica]|uniref:Uncharacterized protein n=1 Tax=Kribbella antibiotica TaxID=190195 RepID=A0A4R4ZV70_9ACTN|nr:hypothetical protein [Kribbella antibiotica]TDD63078.1 hypothetical protein E1263_01870 [Kribbella antibiotica]